MTYGQRLAAARKHKKISQAQLADKSGTSQANVSGLERGTSNGSEFTAQFAVACSVSPLWLATGEGSMEDARFYIQDEELKQSLQAMESLKPYLKKIATTEIIDIIQNLLEVSRKKTQN